jgi:hypothetical protein
MGSFRAWFHIIDLLSYNSKLFFLWLFFLNCVGWVNVPESGEILSFVITQGNVDDREPLKYESFIEKCLGNYMPIEVIFHKHYEIY